MTQLSVTIRNKLDWWATRKDPSLQSGGRRSHASRRYAAYVLAELERDGSIRVKERYKLPA